MAQEFGPMSLGLEDCWICGEPWLLGDAHTCVSDRVEKPGLQEFLAQRALPTAGVVHA